jgi:outer membrane protein TolC
MRFRGFRRSLLPALALCGWAAFFALSAPRAAADPRIAADLLDSLHAAATLDLGLLERAVLARNASLGAMVAAWRESEAKSDQAGALEDPMLDGMLAPRSVGKQNVDGAWSIGLSQRLPLFGQRGLTRRAARAEARAAGQEVRAMRLGLVREARRLYFEAYQIARSRAVNEELRALVEQFRRVALQKYAAGTVGQSDALQAEVEIAMLDHERVVLHRGRRAVAARLQALLHDESGHALPEPPAALPPAPSAGDVTAAASGATLDALPSLRARVAMRDARAAEHRLARRAALPEFLVFARYDRFMDEPEWRPIVGLGLNLPLWRGRLAAQERAARAALERAERERDAARDEARAMLTEARARVEETEHEVHIIETGVIPATGRAVASARAAYETNRGDFLTLLSAERDLARARLSLHRAEAEHRMALADLDRALGIAPAGGEEESKR